MKETGFVGELHGEYASVRVAKKSACGENCAACGGGCVPGERVLSAKNPIGAKPGDRVLVELETGNVLGAAFLAYILPLAVFIAVYVLCMPIIASETAKIILGIGAAAVSVYFVHLLQKRNAQKYIPDIVKIIKQKES